MKKIRLLCEKIIDETTSIEEIEDVLLKNRGLNRSFLKKIDVKEIKATDFGIKKTDFETAIKIIKKTIEKQDNILIYGDYDVDGITSTAILWRAIYPVNKKVRPLIPDREKDGYGLNAKTVVNHCRTNDFWPELLILVDNGIVAQSEIKKLKKNISKVIIIDHHLKNGIKIDVDGVVHSRETSASVLAYLVAREISAHADVGMATLGMVADMTNMSNIYNRNIAIVGLKKLNQKDNIGIFELLNKAGLKGKKVDEWTVGFVIGPRINASGRMGDATRALKLLSFDDRKIIEKLASELENENKNRQIEEKKIMDKFLKKDYGDRKIILEIDKIHSGIIGLVAGKLADKFSRPAIVVTNINKDIYKGSARSVDGFDITKFLRKETKLFETIGGHSQAAGFSIKATNWDKWLDKIRKSKIKVEMKKEVVCDSEISIGAINIKNFLTIEGLRPWGENYPAPLFLLNNLRVDQIKEVGIDLNHLKVRLSGVGGICYGKGYLASTIKEGDMVNVAAQLNLNDYNGKKEVELMVKEIWV